MKVLVVNCGSSSLKYQLIDSETEQALAVGLCERIGIDGRLKHTPAGGEKVVLEDALPNHEVAIKNVLAALTNPTYGVIKDLSEIGAVGHRVVHGGEKFTKSVLIDDAVIAGIKECCDLAPLHNPANLIGIDTCMKLMPGVPEVSVFDTAFHQTMPKEAYLYAVPYEYYEKYGVRRYGFHGTSHSYVSKRTIAVAGLDKNNSKIVVCHLGNGASCSAVLNGCSVDTSMGLTPLEGLIMGTRSGDIDPAVIEFVAKKENKSLAEMMTVLNKKSGVDGLSGVGSDFRDLDAAAKDGNERAQVAVKAFAYRVAKYVGAYAAAMNGVDAIAFTAGIGENDGKVRKMICERLGFLGITIDDAKNAIRGEEIVISTPDSKVKVLVIPTNEELAICRETVALI
ncbi:MAG: acetate kinase [Lachnospiraceae bacterium]|nr:acetate kinase [Lachnospiraceae bacterium]